MTLVSIILLASALAFLMLLGLLGYLWYQNRQQAAVQHTTQEILAERVTTLATHVATIETQMVRIRDAVPLHVALQTILIKELTHFHTPELDFLLTKLGPPYRLTESEEETLLAGLKQRERDMGAEISQSEREAAQMLPLLINRIKREKALTTPTTVVAFQVVSTVPQPPETEGA